MELQDTDCMASQIPVQSTGYFSDLITDYLNEDEFLRPFYSYRLNDEGLLQAIANRKQFSTQRALLVEVIQEQYKDLALPAPVQTNIELLKKENTFTVTSAHQPNLMTGYLYFFYKIIHSVKLAAHLKAIAPDYHFVPVFYIGAEDNDFEELGHFRYAGRVFEWQTKQTGAVGMMQADEALQALIKELMPLLGPQGYHEQKLKEVIRQAYAPGNTIAQAKRIFINEFLGAMGIVVLDANDARLKASFSSIIHQEIFEPKAYDLVQGYSQLLQLRYKAQAFARPINLFYLKEGIRERIIATESGFSVNNTDIVWDTKQMQQEIAEHPERFSPNVILRGLYQEYILPNIAFIGGGSEVAYWMQLKAVFEHYQIPFPVLVLRQSVLIMNQKTAEKQQLLGFSDQKIFSKTKVLIDELVQQSREEEWQLTAYTEQLSSWEDELQLKLGNLDKNLNTSVKAAITKMKQQIEVLDKKIQRSIKTKMAVSIARIQDFKAHSFPNDSLQERYETFMPYYLSYGPALFEQLRKHTDPFGKQFLILKFNS